MTLEFDQEVRRQKNWSFGAALAVLLASAFSVIAFVWLGDFQKAGWLTVEAIPVIGGVVAFAKYFNPSGSTIKQSTNIAMLSEESKNSKEIQ
jgi:predicted outer membrane lipoprotein